MRLVVPEPDSKRLADLLSQVFILEDDLALRGEPFDCEGSALVSRLVLCRLVGLVGCCHVVGHALLRFVLLNIA